MFFKPLGVGDCATNLEKLVLSYDVKIVETVINAKFEENIKQPHTIILGKWNSTENAKMLIVCIS